MMKLFILSNGVELKVVTKKCINVVLVVVITVQL